MTQINCFEPSTGKEEERAIKSCLDSKSLSFGPNVRKFENKFSSFSKKSFNIGMNSASSAAYAVFAYLRENCGVCDVYTPSLGFTSPAWAAKQNGHNLVFVDVDDNLLFDSEDYKKRRNKNWLRKTVVMPVLYGGVSKIPDLNLYEDDIVVLDSAHCINPTMEYDFGLFSFHPVKPICMSNGGILATDNHQADDWLRNYRNFGRRQTEDTYDIAQTGFNFYMNNLNAAIGLEQLKKCRFFVKIRAANNLKLKNGITCGRFIEHDHHSSYYLSTLILDEGISSKKMREYLKENGVIATMHYPFLHKTKYYDRNKKMENLENYSDRIINLPIHQNLRSEELDKIIYLVNKGY